MGWCGDGWEMGRGDSVSNYGTKSLWLKTNSGIDLGRTLWIMVYNQLSHLVFGEQKSQSTEAIRPGSSKDQCSLLIDWRLFNECHSRHHCQNKTLPSKVRRIFLNLWHTTVASRFHVAPGSWKNEIIVSSNNNSFPLCQLGRHGGGFSNLTLNRVEDSLPESELRL